METDAVWPRPVPTVGDATSAADRRGDPTAWAFSDSDRDVLRLIMGARRDIRRFRPDPLPADQVRRLLAAAHQAPSVGHSQPWRFVVVAEPATRAHAALLADQARIQEAAAMETEAGRHLLDLDLEGIREAPVGIVVCCDRRVPAAGVLGRATFPDADMWSCACAIQNLWLAARAEGLGVGWVTLFQPDELRDLVAAPPGVAVLGWLCIGWPDERPPAPGLERRGWSRRQDLDDVVLYERWPGAGAPPAPPSRLAPPSQAAVVHAHDSGDAILSPPGSLGVLDRAVDRLMAVHPDGLRSDGGRAVIAAADHPVTSLGVSAYPASVTRTVLEATVAGVSMGAVSAAGSGLQVVAVDAGVEGGAVPGARACRPTRPKGDLVATDGLSAVDVERLLTAGVELAKELIGEGADLITLGEIGVGNTTVAAALAAGLLPADPVELVGLGAGSDSATVAAKRRAVVAALARAGAGAGGARHLLGTLGGGEFAVLTGVVLGAAAGGAVVVLDGLATSVAALAAVRIEPATSAHLIAGQRSREPGHPPVLAALGLEPLLDLRLRAGEGVGATLAVRLLRAAVDLRLATARTGPDR
ncbi:MAG TPA: 5,6-dimethylbenzimidazole synthase [Acidimicrobiales bacterium]|nr:5,6-dimethylbenzimidazole synthase [Acidimicrobiales bacterium]